MAYSKLFSSIVHSSLWTEEDHVRLLFVTLLAIADREGYIYGSRMGLERLANIISENYDRNPWEVLMDPDSDSSDLMRNPENEGRRIEEVPGGFRILNYCYYRSLRNDEERREQNRAAQQRHREKLIKRQPKSSRTKPPSSTVSQGQTIPSASASVSVSDSDWLKELKEDQAYKDIDVQHEYAKASRWCKEAGRTLTRRTFINWLNKADRKLETSSNNQTMTKYGYPLPEGCSIRQFDGAVLDSGGRIMDINQVRNAAKPI